MKIALQGLIALAAMGGMLACSQQQAQTTTAPQVSESMSAVAAAPESSSASVPTVTTTSAAGSAGMKIYIDPATGQPRDPSPEEIAAASRARVTEQSTTATEAPNPVRVMENGQIEVNVGKRGMHEIRVCRQPDGTLSETNCKADAGKQP